MQLRPSRSTPILAQSGKSGRGTATETDCYSTTTSKSPPWTCSMAETATRETVPATALVMDASIFIASMVAIVPPASTASPTATVTVTAPANGAAIWPATAGSAFSAALTSLTTLLSRISTGRDCPLSVHITVRMPFSSTSETASSEAISRTPFSRAITCSWPRCRP